jgi:hypothetical protein
MEEAEKRVQLRRKKKIFESLKQLLQQLVLCND